VCVSREGRETIQKDILEVLLFVVILRAIKMHIIINVYNKNHLSNSKTLMIKVVSIEIRLTWVAELSPY
jgi:hypothetical protein